jgi:CDP-diacylglycerol--glycerol-3-phosphate 3-phosphatidyltransferase
MGFLSKWRYQKVNLPNRLTILRILLTPVFLVFAVLANRTGMAGFYLAAAVIFSVASYTDHLDGKIARRRNLVTDFGRFADPLADKILTTTALIYLMDAGVCNPIVLVVILSREFAVAGLRMVAAGAKDGKVIAANIWGKWKTVSQMVTVLFFYFGMSIPPLRSFVPAITSALCWLVMLLTLLSGAIYLVQNRSFLSDI